MQNGSKFPLIEHDGIVAFSLLAESKHTTLVTDHPESDRLTRDENIQASCITHETQCPSVIGCSDLAPPTP